jgi:DNA polymerase-1
VDWSQLEIAVAAVKFKDPVLQDELRNGIDLHRENAARIFNCTIDKVTTAQRKAAKARSFGILYGQSAFGLAKRFGISEQDAASSIAMFYDKYKMIKKAHDRLAVLSKYSTGNELLLKTTTGKRYLFKREKYGFRLPQLKDLVCQGTASDLHAHVTGKLWSLIKEYTTTVKVVNTVHDSILFDCATEEVANEFGTAVKKLMEAAARDYMKSDLFKVDIKIGQSWYECKI